ncbi:MarR family winged helix-turn-helix transcriptional regulator [Mycobacteroides abscessus]|uniref:MarR family winged helix-turn-helix transcriptional regulator n=1 Tax=Mycobacteroides abscessus TaxID=36809 RepID=UPI000C26AD82|nr:MarR family transcriptional regulator [Mycobacteroides abscessus]
MNDVRQTERADLPVAWLLELLGNNLRGLMEEALRELGLSPTEFVCLMLLDAQPGLSSSALAREAAVSCQTIDQTVQGLEDSGMVNGRTSKLVRPTALSLKGRRYLRQAQRKIVAAERAATVNLTARERKKLKHMLAQSISADVAGNSIGKLDDG